MAKEGVRQPTNVWLETIVEIVGVKMHEPDKDAWPGKLQDLIYSEHAIWAQIYMRLIHPVISHPASPHQELVLTEDAFCFFEAPSNPGLGCITFKSILAPRITLLMCSDILPAIVEEVGEAYGPVWCYKGHLRPSEAMSLLMTFLLPNRAPRNSWMRVVISTSSTRTPHLSELCIPSSH